MYVGRLQTGVKKENFPEGIGDNMRAYVVNRLKDIDKRVKDAEKEIPAKY